MVRITKLSLPGTSPIEFFAKLRNTEKHAAFVCQGPWTIIAWNPRQRIEGTWQKVAKNIQESVPTQSSISSAQLPFLGGAIGYCSYDAAIKLLGIKSKAKDILNLPEACANIYESAVLWKGNDVYVLGALAYLRTVTSVHQRKFLETSIAPISWKEGVKKQAYTSAFQKIQSAIRSGDIYQLNYAYPLHARSDINPRQLFLVLLQRSSSTCASYFEGSDFSLLSLSPEKFIEIDHRKIATFPIKGTRPRGKSGAEDLQHRKDLEKSSKEHAELAMITDLLRNDIGKVCEYGSVKVKNQREILALSTVWHAQSEVTGILRSGVTPLDAFTSMMPGGSITGCPKKRAVEYIDALEPYRRGPYTGSLFTLSSCGKFSSSILIRTCIANNKNLSVSVGGGIVADSRLEEEYQETKAKARVWLENTSQTMFIAPLGIVTINGVLAHYDDSRLRLLDPMNTESFGVFETLRSDVLDTDLEVHLQRLLHSAEVIGMKVPFSKPKIISWLLLGLKKNPWKRARIKIVATPDDIIIQYREILAPPSSCTAMFVSLTRKHPEAKALPYYREWSALLEARKKGFDEALLVDKNGIVREGAISSLFWVNDGVLSTMREGVLPGITRAKVIARAKELGIPFQYRTITKKQLLTMDEVFLTRSTSGIVPVLKIGMKKIRNGHLGSCTRRLLQAI